MRMRPKLKQAPINSSTKTQLNLPKKQFIQDRAHTKSMTRKQKPKFISMVIESDEDQQCSQKLQVNTLSQNYSHGSFGSPIYQPSQLTNHTSCNSSQKSKRESKMKRRQDKSRLKKEQHKRKAEKEDKKTLALLSEYERLQNQRQQSQNQWERIEKQQFKPLTETDKNKLSSEQDLFLESWEGFNYIPLQKLQQFFIDYDHKALSLDQDFNPDQVAMDVLLSFAFHFDTTAVPMNESRLSKLREEVKQFERAKKQVKQEEELRKELLTTQTRSQIWRLLNMAFNGAPNQDILYRKGDEVEDRCHVCFRIEQSLVNQIVLCNKCGLKVHQSCYGIRYEQIQNFECNRCEFLEKQSNVERKYKHLFDQKLDKTLKSRDERLKNFYFNWVPCSICQNSGGAMVRNSETQEWFHGLCILLNSHKYEFKEIENIRHSGLIRHKIQKLNQQLSPSYSNSTLASNDYECCQLCNRSSGVISRYKEFNGHIMCAILKGYNVSVERIGDKIQVKEVCLPKSQEERERAASVLQSHYCVSEKCPEVIWEDY